MADCLSLLKAEFPDMDKDFIESMFSMMEEVRLDNSDSLTKKSLKYKELLLDGKATRALKIKNKIDAELKLNKNAGIALRASKRQGKKNGMLSPLENIEANELTVDAIADSNQHMMMGIMDVKIENEGLGKAVKSKIYDADVIEVMHSGKEMEGGSARATIVNKIARIYKAMNERERQMMNGAGASIFKRADFVHKQYHNGEAISDAGFDAWAKEMLDRVDHKKSFKGLKQEEIMPKLRKDYERFKSKHDSVLGYATQEAESGRQSHSNTIDILNKGRTYHFKSGKDFKAYNDRFGTQKGLHDTLLTGYARSAKKAALIQKFGHSPRKGFDNFKAKYAKEAGLTPAEAKAFSKEADTAWGIANGEGSGGIDNKLARYSQNARDWSILTMLGKAAWSAGMDIVPTIMHSKTATGDNLLKTGLRSVYHSFLGLSTKSRKRLAKETLVAADAYDQALKEAMMGGNYSPGKLNRAINGMFKWTGLDFVTKVSRKANANMALGDLRTIAKSNKLNVEQKNFIARYGLTSKELATLRENEFLTPILLAEMEPNQLELSKKEHRDLLQKMHIIVNQRVKRGSPLPDNRSRRRLGLNHSKGTGLGEGARFFAQFKSSIMKITQDTEFMLKASSANGNLRNMNTAMAGAQFVILATAVGGMRNLAVEMMKNDEDFDFEEYISNPTTWVRAGVTGGGAAIYGDILAPMFEGRGWVGAMAGVGSFVAGPTLTQATKIGVEGISIAAAALEDGDLTTGIDASTAKTIVNNIPFQNTWYLMNLNTKIAEILGEEFEDMFD